MSSPRKAKSASNVTFDSVRKLALVLPGAEEGRSYGTPAIKVKKNLIARLHQNGHSLVVMIDMAERALRMKLDPETFYITDHYLNYPAMLVRLATVDEEDLRELLEESWRRSAPATLVAAGLGDRQPRTKPGKSLAEAKSKKRKSKKK